MDDLGPTKAPVVVRKARRLRRKRRQHPTNAIEIENENNGKATIMPVTAARYAETIKIDENAEQNYNIYDGPLDSSSNYTGFIEVIGECLLYNISETFQVLSNFFLCLQLTSMMTKK